MARLSDEDGFTVLELMVAMLIMVIITVPLVTSFVLGLSTTRDSLQDTTNSADAQILSAFFDVDVASSEDVRVGANSSCGGASVLELAWSDAGTPTTVAYRLAPADVDVQTDVTAASPGQTVQKLERVACVGAASPVSTTVARSVVEAPTVACPISCNGRPATVSLQVKEFSSLFVNQGSTERRYTLGITASRKVTAP